MLTPNGVTKLLAFFIFNHKLILKNHFQDMTSFQMCNFNTRAFLCVCGQEPFMVKCASTHTQKPANLPDNTVCDHILTWLPK
jgi:hypothetical protein